MAMAKLTTTTITVYKPRITTSAYVAIYKEVKQVTVGFVTIDPVKAYTTLAEANAKAATNGTRP
jgi:hypothetical protein